MTSQTNNGRNGGSASPPASGGAPKGPITDTMMKPLAKRFYKAVSVGEGAFFQILLDGRVVRTPAKRALLLPTRAAAEAVAGEWEGQAEVINPTTMPLTRFSNTAIDAVSEALDDVANDIVSYAGRDLLCYRAAAPPDLVQRQAIKWDPVLDWVQKTLGARFTVVAGVMPVDQPATALLPIAAALEPHDAFRLTALHVMTTLTGSALLALAHARGFLSSDDAWAAAHIDEDYQILLWGQDEEASNRRAHRASEFHAACRLLALVGKGSIAR
jgi:chaperone required for assembly of F1-ATPase